jgi:predicted aspartyl protease
MMQKRFWPAVVRPARLAGACRRPMLALGLMAAVTGSVLPALALAAPEDRKPQSGETSKMPPLAPAAIDDTLVIGGEDIEARKLRTRMTVGVKVNGKGPYRFVVDSGADTSVIGGSVARALQLPAGTPVTLHSMTDTGRVDRVLVDELELGQSTLFDRQLPVLHDRDLGAEGMIGIDALYEQRLLLDFEKRVINIEDAKRPAPRLDGEIIVTARLRHGQLILTQASLNRKPIEAVIDTGSEITIGNLALRDRLIKGNKNQLTTVGATGVTGVKLNLQIATVAEIKLGSVILRNVPIAFADVPPFVVFGLSDHPSLLIGTDLMEKFRRVALDFRARKVRFQLRRCESTGIAISSSFVSHLSVAKGGTEACKR